jgi:hypothetical protein
VRVHARLRTEYVGPREQPKPACGGTQGNLRLYSRPGKNRIDSAFPREVGGRCGVPIKIILFLIASLCAPKFLPCAKHPLLRPVTGEPFVLKYS